MSNNWNMTATRLVCLGFLVAAGCSSAGADDADGVGGGAGGAASSGRFSGTYDVPVPVELTDAAVFTVPQIDWTIEGGTVRLDYDLPLGLVGKSLRVSFEGPYTEGATSVTLTGSAGNAECTIAATSVSCSEAMTGLLPLDPNYDVIEQVAAAEFAGPASERVDVAQRFSGDPIGVVHVDLESPATDDKGRPKNH